MRITALFLLMVIALASLAAAQENNPTSQVSTYELEDLSKTPIQAAWLKTGDFVFFNLLGKRHAIRVDLVYKDNARIVLYPDIDSSPKGAYAPLAQNSYIKIDLNKDEVTDMNIRLDSLQTSEDGEEGLFVFESLVEDDKVPETQGAAVVTTPETQPQQKDNSKLYFLFAILSGTFLGLLVVFGIKKRNSGN